MTPDEFLTEATKALKEAKTDRALSAARDQWMEGELWECQPQFIKDDLLALLRRQVGYVYGGLVG